MIKLTMIKKWSLEGLNKRTNGGGGGGYMHVPALHIRVP